MQLPSRLGQTTLGDVLGALYRERATGTLELIEPVYAGSTLHRVHLRDGLVHHVESPDTVSRLGEILRREGRFGARSRDAERIALTASDTPYGQRLVKACVVSQDDVVAALRRQRRDRLERLFKVGDARLAFRIARRPQPVAQPLGPSEFLHGRPRARQARPPGSVAPRMNSARARALRVLGLGEQASPEQAQRAFRRLAASAHPDRFPHASPEQKAELLRRFAELSAAYHSLVA